MPKTMKDISTEWKELRPLIGNLIGHLTSKEAQLVSMEEAYERGYEKGYNDGFECGQHEVTTLEYQKGLEDAWEAARKLETMQRYQIDELFPEAGDIAFICNEYSAETVIEKLRTYEEQKKAEETQIKIGDEVEGCLGKWVVTYFFQDTNERWFAVGIDSEGQRHCELAEMLKKTGRSFSQVSELLKAMEESNG